MQSKQAQVQGYVAWQDDRLECSGAGSQPVYLDCSHSHCSIWGPGKGVMEVLNHYIRAWST